MSDDDQAKHPEAELLRQEAANEVETALRTMAANLIRVVRGAGAAFDLPVQAKTFVETVRAYREAFGHMPQSVDLAAMIALPGPERQATDKAWRRAMAEHDVIRGSLRIAAAQVLQRHLQLLSGKADLDRALHQLEGLWEEMRREKGAATPSDTPKKGHQRKPR